VAILLSRTNDKTTLTNLKRSLFNENNICSSDVCNKPR